MELQKQLNRQESTESGKDSDPVGEFSSSELVQCIEEMRKALDEFGTIGEAATPNPDFINILTKTLVAGLRSRSSAGLYARIFREAYGMIQNMSEPEIINVLSAPTDASAYLRLGFKSELVADLVPSLNNLSAEDLDRLSPEQVDFLAKLEGLGAREELLRAAGGTLSSTQVAKILKISRQAVDKRRAKDLLLPLPVGRRGFVYPAFQFTETGVVDGLGDVLKSMDADNWQKLIFLLEPHPSLEGKSPMQALNEGSIEKVCTLAKRYGEQGSL